MKILITGGAGFIGSNFVHFWLKKHPKDKIIVYDLLTYAGNIENLASVRKKIGFVKGDIGNRKKLKEALRGIDTVVHFAAESHVERSVFDPASFWRTNVEGTQVLLEECEKAGVKRFHHISTDEVYGELPIDSKERFSEKTPYAPRPDNLYAISKAEADRVVREFAKNSKMNITISNCSNNFGPFQFPEKFIPILVTNLIDGLKAPIHGDGLNVRDWIHTDDHARAIDLILKKGKHGETYLVGSNNDHPNRYIAERVVSLFGKDDTWIRYVPDRHSNDRRYAIDSTKVITELGWKPEITKDNFDEGLRDIMKWYGRNEDWWRPLLSRKTPITTNDNIYIYLSLDRELGKAKVVYKGKAVSSVESEDPKLQERIMEDTTKVKLVKDQLNSRKWYKNTKESLQKQLIELAKKPGTFGFVEDIANRPDEIGGVKQLKLAKIAHAPANNPIYGIATWFNVEGKDGNKYLDSYYSWAMGPKSGAKLLVLLRQKAKITHLAFIKNYKFPVGAKTFDMSGGFPKMNESVFELISRKLAIEMGIDGKNPSMKIGEIIGLGRVMPDPGMTNNHPLLYAVVIDVSEDIFPPLKKGETYEKEDGLILWPIERLTELVNKVDDAYFLSSLARLTQGGLGKIKL